MFSIVLFVKSFFRLRCNCLVGQIQIFTHLSPLQAQTHMVVGRDTMARSTRVTLKVSFHLALTPAKTPTSWKCGGISRLCSLHESFVGNKFFLHVLLLGGPAHTQPCMRCTATQMLALVALAVFYSVGHAEAYRRRARGGVSLAHQRSLEATLSTAQI